MVLKEEFKETVVRCLSEIGIDSETIKQFTEDGAPLSNLNMCTNIIVEFDNKMFEVYPKYEGFMENETFDVVWDFNEPLING